MTVTDERPSLPPTLRPAFASPASLRGPWTLGALLALAAVDLMVVVAVVTAWYHASYLSTPEQQMLWCDVAGVALLFGGGAQAGWLLAGRRAVGRRARALDTATLVLLDPLLPPIVADGFEPHPAAGALVVGDRMTRVHLTSCPLVAGRALEELSAAEAGARGLRPCVMCGALLQAGAT